MDFKENNKNAMESSSFLPDEEEKSREKLKDKVKVVQRKKLFEEKGTAPVKNKTSECNAGELLVTAMRKRLEEREVAVSQEHVKDKRKVFEQVASQVTVKAIRKKLEWETASSKSWAQVKAIRKNFEQEAPIFQENVKAARKKFEQDAVVTQKLVARKRKKLENETTNSYEKSEVELKRKEVELKRKKVEHEEVSSKNCIVNFK
jgi:hypothetical protein